MSTGHEDHALHGQLAFEHEKARMRPQHEKARMWDELADAIARPGLRDLKVHQVSGMHRAVDLLLGYREELPLALATELDSYKVTLDALYLEAADGFADADSVINLLPTHVVISLMGAISAEHDTG